MDARRQWMYGRALTHLEFVLGVAKFIRYAEENSVDVDGFLYCPCVDCKNEKQFGNVEQIRSHLIRRGFVENYVVWSKHGEDEGSPAHEECEDFTAMHDEAEPVQSRTESRQFCDEPVLESEVFRNTLADDTVADGIDRMLRDAEPTVLSPANLKRLEQMRKDAKIPLYEGSKVSKLEANLKLLDIKSSNGLSDKSFDEVLQVVKGLLPIPNCLAESTYKAKQMICPLGLEVVKIHACPKDCILYRGKQYKDLDNCPTCKTPRYKQEKTEDGSRTRGGPAKVVWYFPIFPRIERLFANPTTSKLLRWHAEERKQDNMMRHPADASQWRTIDARFRKTFSCDVRSLRFGLSTDGMNPFNMVSTNHSTWPVTMCIYNLAPWLCMKRTYIMMPILIQGPRQPGNDIDVFLEPLIDDMVTLWEKGVSVWDEYKREHVTVKGMLFVTITDLPGRGSLAGQPTSGYNGCVECLENTDARWLPNTRKMVYMGHRRFLPMTHPYRRNKKSFDGTIEERPPPQPKDGREIFKEVRSLEVVHGKGQGSVKAPTTSLWKKNSFLWRLPYWKLLIVRYSLDVMHTTKNCCESLLGLLMAQKVKVSDSLELRLDLVEMGVRPELHPVLLENGKRELPVASWTLNECEKEKLLSFFHKLKVPTGYCANPKRLVNMKDKKFNISAMKAHDCHVMMTQFLPVALRGVLPEKVRDPIIKFCSFFTTISAKAINVDMLDQLQKDLVHTMCRLEMHLPPTFFTISVHNVIHLVDQIKAIGPTYLHQMFPFERLMSVFRKYVRNKFRPEGCMAQGWLTEEALEFCTYYLDTDRIGVPVSRHAGRLLGKGTIGEKSVRVQDVTAFTQAQFAVLQQSIPVSPYLDEHKGELASKFPGRSANWLAAKHRQDFPAWINRKLVGRPTGDAQLDILALGPSSTYLQYQGYDINGFTFYTQTQDSKSANQNSGVSFESNDGEGNIETYYGFIEEIWELDYGPLKVPLFKCQWARLSSGVFTEKKYGRVIVDLNKIAYRDDPFVLAQDVLQIFYAEDIVHVGKHVVFPGKRKIVGVDGVTDEDTYKSYEEMAPLAADLSLPLYEEGNEPAYVRLDHAEGMIVD